jgi:Family of unknown function (DUF6929)
MAEQVAKPEALPPLELRRLRDLDVRRPAADERRPFVCAASAVVRRGDFTYVIGDDELDLAVFEISRPEPGELRRALPGELPTDEEGRQAQKPDVEALTALPPFGRAPHGGILGLGSGSGPGRDRGFSWALDADGSLLGDAATIDLGPLYDLLRAETPEVNVEGAAVMGEAFWLFNRGRGDGNPNAVAELALTDLIDSLTGDLTLNARELRGWRTYDLGELGGVPLSFSDATPLADDLIAFTASAEADDGAIEGSVVGTISATGEVRRLRTIDRRWKVEGIHAAIDTGVIDLVFVCDQDSDDEPSPLLSATMPMDAAFEAD